DLFGTGTGQKPTALKGSAGPARRSRDYPGVGISPIIPTSELCDNYGTHKTPAIKAWLARHPRVVMHFTPTGSSWLNQVERWFGYLTDQKIRRGTHKSVQALEKDIRDWIADWNTHPRPFIWTKTA